jgi:hypothetical protein
VAPATRVNARLGSAAALLTEPVFRTMYLGQVNLLLMALVIGDLAQPDERRVKGMAVGIAAGIKLIPLVFIPYLLLTRRFRAAAMAAGAFAGTVVLGFLVGLLDSPISWDHHWVWVVPGMMAAAHYGWRAPAGRPAERRVTQYVLFGDRPGYLEYHWRGLQNLSGNAFILTGVALLVLLAVVAVRTRRDAAARPA